MDTLRHDVRKVLSHGKQVMDCEVQEDGVAVVAWFFGFALFWGAVVLLIAMMARAVQ